MPVWTYGNLLNTSSFEWELIHQTIIKTTGNVSGNQRMDGGLEGIMRFDDMKTKKVL